MWLLNGSPLKYHAVNNNNNDNNNNNNNNNLSLINQEQQTCNFTIWENYKYN